ncbi:hypothetical protein SLOPH_717 [Spraguea lophii 42_110]|uniref:Uncharacterized protein n=1 Tax=Spraguea lophii (strain 42_110) TaxID=1358809 RepID=S7XPA0_SPRLO|nr:hypothetical protein SLOPH_717 [Spraguea lophii 42_110]
MKIELSETQYNDICNILLKLELKKHSTTKNNKLKKTINTLLKILSSNINTLPIDSNILEKEEERDLLLTKLSYLRRDAVGEIKEKINKNYKQVEKDLSKLCEQDINESMICDDINKYDDCYDIKYLMSTIESDNNDVIKTMEKCERARKLIYENSKDSGYGGCSDGKAVYNYFKNI